MEVGTSLAYVQTTKAPENRLIGGLFQRQQWNITYAKFGNQVSGMLMSQLYLWLVLLKQVIKIVTLHNDNNYEQLAQLNSQNETKHIAIQTSNNSTIKYLQNNVNREACEIACLFSILVLELWSTLNPRDSPLPLFHIHLF